MAGSVRVQTRTIGTYWQIRQSNAVATTETHAVIRNSYPICGHDMFLVGVCVLVDCIGASSALAACFRQSACCARLLFSRCSIPALAVERRGGWRHSCALVRPGV